jgi:hypothetical protein
MMQHQVLAPEQEDLERKAVTHRLVVGVMLLSIAISIIRYLFPPFILGALFFITFLGLFSGYLRSFWDSGQVAPPLIRSNIADSKEVDPNIVNSIEVHPNVGDSKVIDPITVSPKATQVLSFLPSWNLFNFYSETQRSH